MRKSFVVSDWPKFNLCLKAFLALAFAGSIGILTFLTFRHVFLEGNCCADDGYFSFVAKTLANTGKYGLPVSPDAVTPLSAEIGSGPALIVPAALMIKAFGATPWMPALTSVLLQLAQYSLAGWFLRKVFSTWSLVAFSAAAALAVIATTTYQYYYMLFLGEGPGLGFIVLGCTFLVLAPERKRYFYASGAMFAFALLTKYIEAFPIAGCLSVWLIWRLATQREGLITDIWRVAAAGIIPIILFELVKLSSLGVAGYVAHWTYFVEFTQRLHGAPSDRWSTTVTTFADGYHINLGIIVFCIGSFAVIVHALARKLNEIKVVLPMLFFGGAFAHLTYSIFFSSLSARYIWPGVALMDLAVASPLLVYGFRSSIVAFPALFLLVATPAAISRYYNFHTSFVRGDALRERASVLEFIRSNPELPLVSQWWGTIFEVLYLENTGHVWKLTNDKRDVGTLPAQIVLNSHFLDRNEFYNAVTETCQRQLQHLKQYEVYTCAGRFLPIDSVTPTPRDMLPVGEVRLDPAFSQSGWFEKVGPPPGEVGWGSFATQGDSAVGEMSIKTQLPAGKSTLAVPVITGPSSGGATFRLMSGSSGKEIAVLVAPEGASQWRLWRVNVPPEYRNSELILLATDNGSEWGQWVGVGQPFGLTEDRDRDRP